MRKLKLEKKWRELGAKFGEFAGAQRVDNFGDTLAEIAFIRNSAALCDFSFVEKFSFSETDGIDFLDSVLAANILKLRYGRIVDTFLADSDGNIAAETFVADVDDMVFVFAEPLAESSCKPLMGGEAPTQDLTENFAMLSVDGPDSWKVARDIFGTDILNLPYLSIEKYAFEDAQAYLLRSGKTGEFGYQFLVPEKNADALADKLIESVKSYGGGLCGFDAHRAARLEGNFFDICEEGARVKNPIELGLQWMVDFGKEKFFGCGGIFAIRSNGVGKKIVCLKMKTPIAIGQKIFDGTKEVGEVVAAQVGAGAFLALALFDKKFAASGFDFSTSPDGVADVRTVSRPPIVAQSLKKGMEQ